MPLSKSDFGLKSTSPTSTAFLSTKHAKKKLWCRCVFSLLNWSSISVHRDSLNTLQISIMKKGRSAEAVNYFNHV